MPSVRVLNEMTVKQNGVLTTYKIGTLEGYYNSTDGKFYADSLFTTEIEAASGVLYVDLTEKKTYIYDTTEAEYVLVGGGGGAAEVIKYVDNLPVGSNIEDIIYGNYSTADYDETVAEGFLDENDNFIKESDTYTPASGLDIQASADNITYKDLVSLALVSGDYIATYSDSNTDTFSNGDTFYYKVGSMKYYAGDATNQKVNLLAGGGGGGGTTYTPGEGIHITSDVISVAPATSSTLGGVKTDNSTIIADANGTISGNYQAGFNVDIDGNTIKTKEFVGTTAEWNSLTAAQKAQYTFTMFSDDFFPVDATPGHGIADSTGAEKTQRNTLQFGNEMEVTDDSTNEVTKVNAIPYTAGDKIDITNHEISVDETVKTTFIGTIAEWEALTTVEKAEYELVSLTDDPAGGDMYVEDAVTEDSINPVTSGAVYDALVNKQDKTDNSLNTTAKTVVGGINELKSGKQDNLVISGTTSVSVGGGFTGGTGIYYKYGRLVFFSFNCYYAGPLAANTNHIPFSGLPKALYNDNIITVSNGGYAARAYVNTGGQLILNPWQQIPANTYLTGTVIYLSAT